MLYAGGTSLLWLEGLSQRIGAGGFLTALDSNAREVEERGARLWETELAAPVRLVVGDVFEPPFEPGTFDLVYSAGLLHELNVSKRPATDALRALASLLRPGGRLATGDFVDTVTAAQLEDEEIQAVVARESSGARLFGIGSPERLVELHEEILYDVRWKVFPPRRIRHLDKVFLAEDDADDPTSLPPAARRLLRLRRGALRERVAREGYTRPATLFVEGIVAAR